MYILQGPRHDFNWTYIICVYRSPRVLRLTVITVYEGRPSEGDEKKIIIINKTTAEKKWIPANL